MKTRQRISPCSRGFMLIEVLLALVVLSVTFVSCLGAFAQSLWISKTGIQRMKELLAAESQIWMLEAGARPDLVLLGGTGEEGGSPFSVEVPAGSNAKDKGPAYRIVQLHSGALRAQGLSFPIYLPERSEV